jgi:hypothetical protein
MVMAVRALIVAIEDYPNSAGLAAKLDGTNAAAKAICDWLASRKGVFPKGDPKFNPKTFFCCADPALSFSTHGTTRSEIIRAVEDLVEAAGGDEGTEQLYCYISGHGFCYPQNQSAWDDLFVASDFRKLNTGGGACLKLNELMDLLKPALGPGDHYYFFDACRTEVQFNKIRPSDMGVMFDRSQLGSAGKAVLYSIEQGLAARTDSAFSQHLAAGLGGAGRAKTWHKDGLYVKFESLRNYVQEKMRHKLSHSIGESEGLILKIDPIPEVTCTIHVGGVSTGERFTYVVKQRSNTVKSGEFSGSETTVALPPDEYRIEVYDQQSAPLASTPAGSDPIDLFESATVVFERAAGGLESMEAAGGPTVGGILARATPDAVIRIEGLERNVGGPSAAEAFRGGLDQKSLDPGSYRLIVEERGRVVESQAVEVKAGEIVDVDFEAAPESPLHDQILEKIGQAGKREVWFSETLGSGTMDRDLGMWMALLGASRVIGHEGEFSKLSRVPLQGRFDQIPEDQSALYGLAAFDGHDGPWAIGLGKDPVWTEMMPVEGVQGLFECVLEARPGSQLVTFQAKGRIPVTLSTHTLPNRATVLSLSRSAGDAPVRMYQFMLPIRSLMGHLDAFVRQQIEAAPLKHVRFVVESERLFMQEHSLSKAFGPQADHVDQETREHYRNLIYSKWLDPVGSLIAASDLLKRGVLNPQLDRHSPLFEFRSVLPGMVRNLRWYFGGISDVEAIARAIGEDWRVPTAPPLLAYSAAGFRIDEQQAFMPFENRFRKHDTSWLAWTGAVPPHFVPRKPRARRQPKAP